MSRWPDIDWSVFGAAVDDALRICSAKGFSTRELSYRHGVSVSALSRARDGKRVAVGDYLAICKLLGLDPSRFLINAPRPLPQDIRFTLAVIQVEPGMKDFILGPKPGEWTAVFRGN